MTRPIAPVLALFALVVLGTGVLGTNADANGVPQLVKLTYLDGISNYGPADAEGVLEFSFAEAYARVDVKNLTPADGISYEGWMVAPDGSALWIGQIEVPASGVASYETKIVGLDRYDYNLFVIAARNPETPTDAVPQAISIAGRFTLIDDDPESGNKGDIRPALLPDTGEKAPGTPWGRIGLTLAAMAGTGLMLVGIRQFIRRDAA